MIRRLLWIGGIGSALVVGGRFALAELTERAWDARRAQLHELALFQPKERRPWELRFESLSDRLRASPRLDEIQRSPYRPRAAMGEEPRALDEFERIWLESLWNELVGLEGVLAELRRLPFEELAWHGTAQSLIVLRECTDALCGRARLLLDENDPRACVRTYADALRLARATDDGSTTGTMVSYVSERIVLDSLRAALTRGLDAALVRGELGEPLASLGYSPERAARVIRRDLSYLENAGADIAPSARQALTYFTGVEEALEIAHAPLERTPWAMATPLQATPLQATQALADNIEDPRRQWNLATRQLHGQHAQRNVALTALAVSAFRARHGAFPATLAEVEDLPADQALDPLTGKPLAYSTDGTTTDSTTARVGPAAWGERVDVYPHIDDSPYVWTLR